MPSGTGSFVQFHGVTVLVPTAPPLLGVITWAQYATGTATGPVEFWGMGPNGITRKIF
jgi:hypothetical protein